MTTIKLTKEKPTSGEIGKYPNRYININIKKGTVVIKLTKANGEVFQLPSTIHGTVIKWDIIDFIKIEFLSDDAVIDYKLFFL